MEGSHATAFTATAVGHSLQVARSAAVLHFAVATAGFCDAAWSPGSYNQQSARKKRQQLGLMRCPTTATIPGASII